MAMSHYDLKEERRREGRENNKQEGEETGEGRGNREDERGERKVGPPKSDIN